MDIHLISPNSLRVGDKTYRCAIGKGGLAAAGEKREGDHKTPMGCYALREVWYRPDKLERLPVTVLPLRAISRADGWCDDPAHADYNRHILLCHPVSTEGAAQDLARTHTDPVRCRWQPQDDSVTSHETLWRDEDDCYDLIVPLGYNDDPPVAGKGSAIFLHVAKADYAGTEGCVALAKEDVLEILSLLDISSVIHILPDAVIKTA